MDTHATAQRDLSQYLTQAEAVILSRRLSEKAEPTPLRPEIKLGVWVRLGTAYLVLVSRPVFVIPLGLALHDPPQ